MGLHIQHWFVEDVSGIEGAVVRKNIAQSGPYRDQEGEMRVTEVQTRRLNDRWVTIFPRVALIFGDVVAREDFGRGTASSPLSDMIVAAISRRQRVVEVWWSDIVGCGFIKVWQDGEVQERYGCAEREDGSSSPAVFNAGLEGLLGYADAQALGTAYDEALEASWDAL